MSHNADRLHIVLMLQSNDTFSEALLTMAVDVFGVVYLVYFSRRRRF